MVQQRPPPPALLLCSCCSCFSSFLLFLPDRVMLALGLDLEADTVTRRSEPRAGSGLLLPLPQVVDGDQLRVHYGSDHLAAPLLLPAQHSPPLEQLSSQVLRRVVQRAGSEQGCVQARATARGPVVYFNDRCGISARKGVSRFWVG